MADSRWLIADCNGQWAMGDGLQRVIARFPVRSVAES
jgi:hypothetical protein